MTVRIYITGSGGVLGKHTCQALAQQMPRAEVLRNRADLTDLAATTQALQGAGPVDLVIHLAALVPVDEVHANPARGYAVNVGGTINLLAALAKAEIETGGMARFLHCSSGHVYSSQNRPIREDDPTDPITVYGKTKLLGEQVAREICGLTGRSICVARLFSIHDAAQQGNYLRPALERRLKTANAEAPFELHGAGSLRDFLPAEVAADQLTRLAKLQVTEKGAAKVEGAINLGSGQPQTVAAFAQSLASFPLKIKPMGTDNNLVPDVSRLNEILGE